MSTTKTYYLNAIDTLKLQANFTQSKAITYAISQTMIENQKVIFDRDDFMTSVPNHPMVRFEVNYLLNDVEYDTEFESGTRKTQATDYFKYTNLPNNFSHDTMEVLYCVDRSPSTLSQLTLNNNSNNSHFYIQKDKYGTGNIGTCGCVYIIDKTTRQQLAYSDSTGVQYPEGRNSNAYTCSPFECAVSGEPSYRTVEMLTATLILKDIDKVFATPDDALYYIATGDDSLRLDGESEEPAEPEEETANAHKYYRLTQYRYTDLGMTNLVDVVTKNLEITFEDYPINSTNANYIDNTCGNEPIIATVDTTNMQGNVHFVIHNGFSQFITSSSVVIGNTTTSNPSSSSIMGLSVFSWGIVESTNPHYYIKSVVKTNMIVKNASGQTINNALTDSDDMLGNTNTADYDCGLSECWLIDKNAMKNIAQTFNTTIKRGTNNSSAYVMGEWIVGLSAYSNPLDVVCDLFYMPIDLTDYCTTTTTSFSLIPPSNEEE